MAYSAKSPICLWVVVTGRVGMKMYGGVGDVVGLESYLRYKDNRKD